MSSGGGAAIFVVAILLVGVVACVWHINRSRSLLEEWAGQNGYRVIESSYRSIMRGPFFWTTSKGQTVYRVTVEDRTGRVRSGWVRCGSFWGGLLSDPVQVRWDDEA